MRQFGIALFLILSTVASIAQTVYEGNSIYGRTVFCWDGTYAYCGEMTDEYIPYTWSASNNWIYAGRGTAGDRLFYWDGTHLYRGNAEYNVVIVQWDGKHLIQGKTAKILYTLEDGKIRCGDENSPVMFTYDGDIPPFIMYLMLTY